MRRTILAIATMATVAGCALPKPPQSGGWTIDDAIAETGIVCANAQQCSDWWRRTQYWISTNSGYKIQTATDVVIETYNPGTYSMRWGFSARKEPLANGQERITVMPNCGPAPICRESKAEMISRARGYIVGG